MTIENFPKNEKNNEEEFWRNSEIYPKSKEYYKWFTDCIKEGITYENVLKFSDVARKLIDDVRKGKDLTDQDWCVSKSIQVLEPNLSNKAHIYSEGRPDLFIDKRGDKKDKKHLTFLESVDGVDRGMSEWITDENVFKLAKGEGFKYEGLERRDIYKIKVDERGVTRGGYASGEELKETLKTKQKIADRELLLGLMDGDEKLVDEFIKTINPDLTKLHAVGGVEHDGHVTRMIGIKKNKIMVWFADDVFRFMVNKDQEKK